ncbi:MAG: LysR family transcriptional regulator [Erysipelothrix sp.]
MDNKLQTFIKVYELKSYTKAAETLHLTQPAVSQQIKKLEAQFDCKLVNTRGGKMEFTEYADILYQFAKANAQQIDTLHQNIKLKKQKVSFGMTLSIADYYFPDDLGAFLVESSHESEIVIGNTEELLELMKIGQLDAALIEGSYDRKNFEGIAYRQEPFIAVTSSKAQFDKDSLDLEDLFNKSLLIREEGSGTRKILEDWLFLQNESVHSFKHIVEVANFVAIKNMLLNDNCISFMYEGVARKEIKSGKLRKMEIESFNLQRSFHFVTSKNQHHPLIDVLKSKCIKL